jgi:two-component system C4-dicarboxylate transport sensor histidine kinase DctB
MTSSAPSGLALAHARFARAATGVYLGTAAVAVSLLVAGLLTDRSHQEDEARQKISLLTELRAHALAQHLELLAGELTRLGQRSEVDFGDQNADPERSLLRLTHENSALFSEGVGLLDARGTVISAVPPSLLPDGRSLEGARWFRTLGASRRVQVDAFTDDRANPQLVVAVPVLRGPELQGVLLGVLDPTREAILVQPAQSGERISFTLLAGDGQVLFPRAPNPILADPAWPAASSAATPVAEARLASRDVVISTVPVANTSFRLVGLADATDLFGPARSRFRLRLGLGLLLSAAPIVVLVRLLRGSLRAFQKTEEDVVRDERLRSLGEAVDLIAHEVRNSLNGIRVGLDVVLRGSREPRNERALAALRSEIERLSTFSTELLGFSKGVVPRPVAMDLVAFVQKVSDLARDTAEGQGVRLEIGTAPAPIPVRADPGLLHVVIANLVGNAVEFAGSGDSAAPRVEVDIVRAAHAARVRVADNGPGVPATVKPRLFEPFVTSRPNGVGIGLALSRRIARAHGGDLVLDEACPSGASFILTLPLSAA